MVRLLKPLMNLKHTQSSRTRVPGLTLVEVMIVLALIGVLAAIVMPMYTNYRERIDRSTAIQDIRILQLLIADYAAPVAPSPRRWRRSAMAASSTPGAKNTSMSI